MKVLKKSTKVSLLTLSFLMALFFVSCAGQSDGELFDETLKASMDEEMGESIEEVEEIGSGESAENSESDAEELLALESSTEEANESSSEEVDDEMAALMADEGGDNSSSDLALNSEADESLDALSSEGDENLSAPSNLDADSINFDSPAAMATEGPAPAAAPAPRAKRRVAKSSTPEIASDAIVEGGKTLNRYYFVRPGDTPAQVSKLIYGSEDRVADLLASAGGTPSWEPGTPVYYTSPDKPNDNKMRSFYYERTVKPQTYTVQAGDTLAKIAEQNYGNVKSWKEIAVVNQLKSPSDLEEGQLLALAPQNLAEYSKDNWIVAKPLEDITQDLGPESSRDLADAERAQAKEEFARTETERNNGQQAGVGIGGFLRQNWLFLGVVITIGLAALFFLIILPRQNGY